MNCAPAISNDGCTVYIAVNIEAALRVTQTGYLLALGSATLATRAKVTLVDPNLNAGARISDNGTATPVVGADGAVYAISNAALYSIRSN